MQRFPYWPAAAFLVLASGCALVWWLSTEPVLDAPDAALPDVAASHEPVQPIPAPAGLDAARVALGEALFHDPQLSADNSLSCAACHDLKKGGTDQRPVSVGIKGARGDVNAPTVFNASLNFVQFWDGRAASLEEQAAGPIHNPGEMGSNWPQVIGKLRKSDHYVQEFARIYPQGITPTTIADAIATYERSLLTPGSRFDAWLKGDETALTQDELAGYKLFKNMGCVSCHQGANLGGNMYQKFGIFAEFRPSGRGIQKSDLGRFNLTGKDEDRAVFKVPGLRNIALTAPYFHDGSAPDLDAAVATMARVQLGRSIEPEQVRLIALFLRTLTGRYRGEAL